DLVGVLEGVLAWQLQVERDLRALADLEDDDVVHLVHARIAERGRVGALAEGLGLLRLDVHDDIGSWNRSPHGLLDRVRGRVTLLDSGRRRDGDDDVREVMTRGAAHAQAPELYARAELLDRRP